MCIAIRRVAGILAKQDRLNTCDPLPPLVVYVGPEAIDNFVSDLYITRQIEEGIFPLQRALKLASLEVSEDDLAAMCRPAGICIYARSVKLQANTSRRTLAAHQM